MAVLTQQALELCDKISKTAQLAEVASAKVRILDQEQCRVRNAVEQVDKAQQLKVTLHIIHRFLLFKELHCGCQAGHRLTGI